MINKELPRVGVDWGSTHLRAYLFDDRDQLIDTVESPNGIKSVHGTQFESILFDVIGHWLKEGATVLLSGMITSRNGWCETPYISVPSELNDLLSNAQTIQTRGVTLHFLPGLSQNHTRADVMRGEELQLLGLPDTYLSNTVVLPGTHSKWVQLDEGTVQYFQTIVTGEIFDVLLNRTLVGQLAQGTAFDSEQFTSGVQKGYKTSTIISDIFSCRSRVLLQSMNEAHVHSYLSGLLIGNEIREGLSNNNNYVRSTSCSVAGEAKSETGRINTDKPVVLIGSNVMCERYTNALKIVGIPSHVLAEAPTGSAFLRLFNTIA